MRSGWRKGKGNGRVVALIGNVLSSKTGGSEKGDVSVGGDRYGQIDN